MTDSTTTKKVVDLLTNNRTTKATVLMSQDKLFDFFKSNNCKTKSQMIISLFKSGYDQASIAKTLLEYNVLSEKSSRQHVRNTIENYKLRQK